MNDKDKTHKQLITELTQLRRRIAELEAAGRKRNQFEESLRTERDKAQQYLDIAEVMLVVLDKKGSISLINRKGNQILGYKEGELIGKNWFTTCLPTYLRKDVKGVFKKLMMGEGEQTEYYENPVLTKSGTERIIAWHNTVLKGKTGNIIGTLSSGEDITERKRGEEEIERLASFPKLNPMPIVEVDQKGQPSYTNPAAQHMFPDLDKKQGKHPFLDGLKPYFSELQQTKRKYLVREVKVGGGWYSQTINLADPEHIRIYAADITERKGAEEALRESEEKFRNLAEQSPNMIFINAKGRVVYANEKCAEIVGYTREVFYAPDFDFMTLIAPESIDVIKEVYSKHMQSEEVPPYEYALITREGYKIEALIATKLIQYAGEQAILGVVTDITERKKAEQELQHSYQQLHEMLVTTVNTLTSMVEMKDRYTAGHQPRVAQLACAIAEAMDLSEEQIEGIRMAGLVHDIGKINIPAEILSKPGQLTEIQYDMVKMHPQASYDILKGIKFPWPVTQIVLQHHERMDGSGYPQGLSGEEILLEARILAVANVVEAMTSHRPYRPAYDIKEVLQEISQKRGVFYDPDVVDACLKLFTEKQFTFD